MLSDVFKNCSIFLFKLRPVYYWGVRLRWYGSVIDVKSFGWLKIG